MNIDYYWVRTAHLLATIVAVGPLLILPWLAARMKKDHSGALLDTILLIDRVYNGAGWILIVSGAMLMYVSQWLRMFELWFVLSVLLFVIDSVVEKQLREPACQRLRTDNAHVPDRATQITRLQCGIMVQTVSSGLIVVLMLLHGQGLLAINLLDQLTGQWQ